MSVNLNSQPIGYSALNERKTSGSHYTPKELSDFVADEILKYWQPSNEPIKVIDPAIGDGELLLSIAKKLGERINTTIDISGYDIDQFAINTADQRLKEAKCNYKFNLKNQDFLEYSITQFSDTLFSSIPETQADIIIANPPYVRTQVLGSLKSQDLSKQFGLKGRVDLYHAFLYCIARIIKPGGIVGIIVSNRFMTTKSGETIRKDIIENFDVLHVWDLGDTQLFEAAVLPAVLILRRKSNKNGQIKSHFSSIYSYKNNNISDALEVESKIKGLNEEGIIKVDKELYVIKHGNLDYGTSTSGVWRISNNDLDQWLDTVQKNTYLNFKDIGKTRVGVKTTADKVFIRTSWDDFSADQKPELLKPLITHFMARRYKGLIDKYHYILYTHEVKNGKRQTINLDEYPKSKKYLNAQRDILEKREYIKQANRMWYEIWVPQDPDLWKYPKMVFRDISEKPTFWLDLEGAVVNGDCYWLVVTDPKKMDLLWLAIAVANSTFIEQFYDRSFNNKLYSGRRRFITQYVERFPIPNPNSQVAQNIILIVKEIYDLLPTKNVEIKEKELDQLVWKAFGFNP